MIKTHVYTETCIKRSPLEQRKVVFLDGLPLKRGSIHMKFLWQDKKKWCFKTGDSLIEVMSWAGFTAFLTFLLWGIRYFWKIVEFEVIMWYKYISCDTSIYHVMQVCIYHVIKVCIYHVIKVCIYHVIQV